VISVVNENTITTDLGHKSVAAENPLPRVHFLNAAEAIPFSQSEEHLVLKVNDAWFIPTRRCAIWCTCSYLPNVALYEKASVIENNTVVEEWNVVGGQQEDHRVKNKNDWLH
jgi:hypothetical protein